MESEQFHRIAKALGDRRRFELFSRIAQESEMACAVLVEEFPIGQATISHHLRELTETGLLQTRREGKFAYLRVDAGTYREYLDELAKRVLPAR